MNERNLILFCLVGALSGIVALYFISMNLNFIHVKVGDIGENELGDIVNVTGTLENPRMSGGHLFFTLRDDTGKIKTVIWNDTLEFLQLEGLDSRDFEEGRHIRMLASVQLYMGELELVPLREYMFLYT